MFKKITFRLLINTASLSFSMQDPIAIKFLNHTGQLATATFSPVFSHPSNKAKLYISTSDAYVIYKNPSKEHVVSIPRDIQTKQVHVNQDIINSLVTLSNLSQHQTLLPMIITYAFRTAKVCVISTATRKSDDFEYVHGQTYSITNDPSNSQKLLVKPASIMESPLPKQEQKKLAEHKKTT
jgi:hypothetical protein